MAAVQPAVSLLVTTRGLFMNAKVCVYVSQAASLRSAFCPNGMLCCAPTPVCVLLVRGALRVDCCVPYTIYQHPPESGFGLLLFSVRVWAGAQVGVIAAH